MENKMSSIKKATILSNFVFEKLDIICFENFFYQYKNDIWEKMHDEEFAMLVNREAKKVDEIGAVSLSLFREVKQQLNNLTWEFYGDKIKNLNNNNNEICLNSNILHIKDNDFSFTDYQKESFKFNKLPYNYNDKIKIEDLVHFKKFIIEIMDYDSNNIKQEDKKDLNELINFILEWIGYTLIRGNFLQKSLICVGEGGNGKGVLMEIWKKLVGLNNVASFDLSLVNKPEFAITAKDKLVHFSSDLKDSEQLDTTAVKRATIGEEVEGKKLYSQPFTFNYTAKIIILTNELPYIHNMSNSVKRRFYLLPFNRVFTDEERDVNLIKKLESEIEGIFYLCITALKRLIKRGHFIVPEKVQRLSNLYFSESDIVEQFLSEKNLNDTVNKRSAIYSDFKDYCVEIGKKPYGRNKFLEKMRRKGFTEFVSSGIFYLKKT